MGLKFDGICSGTGNGINVGMGGSQTAVMGLGDLRYNQARLAPANDTIAYFKGVWHGCFL
jgi:hypothetical protein